MNAYEQAAARIAVTPELKPYRDRILHDGPQGDAYYQWAATCDLAELMTWCEAATRDEREDVAGLLAYQRKTWAGLQAGEGSARAEGNGKG